MIKKHTETKACLDNHECCPLCIPRMVDLNNLGKFLVFMDFIEKLKNGKLVNG